MDYGPPTIRLLLNRGAAYLVEHGVPNARRNAEWVLADQLRCGAVELYTRSEITPPQNQSDAFWRKIERRARREPLQYILGNTEFMSLPFEIPHGVFIPRPDTELLVETTETLLRERRPYPPRGRDVLDLCCGSGVIAVSLASRVAGLNVVAVDNSDLAVRAAARNAALNGVSDRVRCELGAATDYLDSSRTGSTAEAGGRFTAVVCNPPYIETGVMSDLPPEVRDFEPREALDGGPDGLAFYREVADKLPGCLAEGGFVVFEIGDEQAAAVTGILGRAGFARTSVERDYAGHDRVITGLL